MDFTSVDYYFVFLPLVIATLLAFRNKNRKWSILLLVASSYIFFWFSSGWFIALLIISTTVDYIIGNQISDSKNKKKRKFLLIFSLLINLGILCIFKYAKFIYSTIEEITSGLLSDLTGHSELVTLGPMPLILPVGISFYTFQTMSYTIDIYRGKIETYDSWIDFACYASFFPQLVAGPIVRSEDFRKEINGNNFGVNKRGLQVGAIFIIMGLFKKLVLSNTFAIQVNMIFNENSAIDYSNYFIVILGALFFGIQIYCDFSGYTDIALGSARIFGIKLPENFDYPYTSKSMREFWRRWHISLSTWLRDYLYISMGGSRNGVFRTYIALMMTMILGGLWHGAAINFIIWGVFHGFFLVIERVVINYLPNIKPKTRLSVINNILSLIYANYVIFSSWIIFRVSDFEVLSRCMKTIFFLDCNFDYNEAWTSLTFGKYISIIYMIMFFTMHFISRKNGRLRDKILEQNIHVQFQFMFFLCICIFFLRPSEQVEFIYFRF